MPDDPLQSGDLIADVAEGQDGLGDGLGATLERVQTSDLAHADFAGGAKSERGKRRTFAFRKRLKSVDRIDYLSTMRSADEFVGVATSILASVL